MAAPESVGQWSRILSRHWMDNDPEAAGVLYIVQTQLDRSDDARSLIREIFATDTDLIPDEENKTLTVQLHHLTNHLSDQAARNLAANLNATETIYPGMNLRLIYKLVSDEIPPDQEV